LKPTARIYLIISLILNIQEIFSQGTWERIDSPITEDLSSVFFVDSLYGWAAGFYGTIIHTSDGGENWLIQNSQTESNIEDIFFISRDIGFAIFWEISNFPFGTLLLKSTNGGESWTKSNYTVESCFGQSIFFQDSLNGWIGGKPYPLVRTTDGGNLWEEALIDSSTYATFPVYDIKFFNSDIGYASGGVFDCCGIIWLTTNSGDSWNAIDTPHVAPEPIYALHLVDSLQTIGVGGDFESWGFGVGVINSSDGGGSWEFGYIGTSGVAWDIDFRTNAEAWVPLGGEASLIYSLDSGKNWTSYLTPDSALIFSLTFPDSLHGFGVGDDGVIIRYKPDSTTRITAEKRISHMDFYLEQNYPNPFNPSTRIEFQTSKFQFINLKVFDILGREIESLVSEFKPAGRYEVEFNADKHCSGVYYYVLSTTDFSIYKKMIILK
jgi:photosystem II stability/assembly factor-like uncharacterized protein